MFVILDGIFNTCSAENTVIHPLESIDQNQTVGYCCVLDEYDRMTIMPRKKQALDFEQSLQALEKLVEQLESGELSLEESLQTFEQGIKLTRQCQEALKEAEQKVQLLVEKKDSLSTQPFAEEDDA